MSVFPDPNAMKAMAVDEFGHADKLTLHFLPVPVVDVGEVLIRIEIAGVGIWDVIEREGSRVYNNEVHFPRVLGGECAGTIVATGGTSAFPNGVMPEPEAPNGVELKKVKGAANRTLFDQLNRLINMSEFQVHISQTFLLEEAAQAQEAMKQHYLGKIVLRVSGAYSPLEFPAFATTALSANSDIHHFDIFAEKYR